MTDLATSFRADLPSWAIEHLATAPAAFDTDEAAMAFCTDLARRNQQADTGGPFAALVLETATGRLVSAGVNLVLASGLSSTHAEVVALSLAQTRLGRWDLGAAGNPAHTLLVNWRPCVMCGGAALWSGVTRIVIAGDGPELEVLTGFDEGPVHPDWIAEMARRGIAVEVGVGRDAAIEVFREYGARTDAVVYNARGTSRTD
ncbi:nucleoside deaminase [Gryllotalpicola sp.]|uniref:nucleoside deaminase n=1 Tax=Gryllotalpicola sp. TaxID=1932787 RepID=UPI002619F03F|nr:nucleoside deaminase [Gryllotalpicola sp.]